MPLDATTQATGFVERHEFGDDQFAIVGTGQVFHDALFADAERIRASIREWEIMVHQRRDAFRNTVQPFSTTATDPFWANWDREGYAYRRREAFFRLRGARRALAKQRARLARIEAQDAFTNSAVSTVVLDRTVCMASAMQRMLSAEAGHLRPSLEEDIEDRPRDMVTKLAMEADAFLAKARWTRERIAEHGR